MRTTKKNSLWSKIETRDDALKVVKDVSIAFYVLAALQAIIGLFYDQSLLMDAALYVLLAFLLQRFRSRVVAVVLLAFALLAMLFTGQNIVGGGPGGNNIILALIMTWAAVRAIQATFFLHKARR
jgi:hypothetical protein